MLPRFEERLLSCKDSKSEQSFLRAKSDYQLVYILQMPLIMKRTQHGKPENLALARFHYYLIKCSSQPPEHGLL